MSFMDNLQVLNDAKFLNSYYIADFYTAYPRKSA